MRRRGWDWVQSCAGMRYAGCTLPAACNPQPSLMRACACAPSRVWHRVVSPRLRNVVSWASGGRQDVAHGVRRAFCVAVECVWYPVSGGISSGLEGAVLPLAVCPGYTCIMRWVHCAQLVLGGQHSAQHWRTPQRFRWRGIVWVRCRCAGWGRGGRGLQRRGRRRRRGQWL